MNSNYFNSLSRRAFFDRSFKIGAGVALATLTDIPFVMKRALAEGTIGLNGKKVLFIFLRGANDALNSVIPIQDSGYNTDTYTVNGVTRTARPNIAIPKEAGVDYSLSNLACDYPGSSLYTYANAIRLGNGFCALHPSLKYLAPVYNAGDLALIHRVGYPRQSRSHFDSQIYWENGIPNDNATKDGIFYRAMLESGLAHSQALTGVSIQTSLPLILRGSAAAMTNLSDPTRYNLLGIPNTTLGNMKADQFIAMGNGSPFAPKINRDLLDLQYRNLSDTLAIFSGIDFNDSGNTFTDPDTGYYLFPATDAKNSGQCDLTSQTRGFFTNLKAAALVLNKTDAIVAGTELGGFDTHIGQGGVAPNGANSHPQLMRRVGWAMYALRKYFMSHSDKVNWNNLVVITLSEFGRTSKQNGSTGTDHAEAGVMFVAGGGVKGYGKNGRTSGVFNCAGAVDPIYNPLVWNTGLTGSMFTISSNYVRRTTDFRQVLGRIIRKHLGAQFDEANPYAPSQLGRIIPGYTSTAEKLFLGGLNTIDSTTIAPEIDFI